MKVIIEVEQVNRSNAIRKSFTIEGKVKLGKNGHKRIAPNTHDIAAALFAIEFAANNQTNVPGMRVHIFLED